MSARSAINLLPWRELERARRNRTAIGALVGALLGGAAVVSAFDLALRHRVEAQESRNRLLETEIAVLERQVEAVRNLRRSQEELLARLVLIHRLRNSRQETVRIFNELANTMARGVHYLKIVRRGDSLDAEGVAASAQLVSVLMRNLENSEWFAVPRLLRVRKDPHDASYGPGASNFELAFAPTVAAGAAAPSGMR